MPKPETVTKALAEIGKSGANYRYFFENLKSPDWLGPLTEHELFRNPPEKEPVEGGFTFPGWAASEYLSRMAKVPEAQQRVLRILLDMRDTDNPNVHRDLLDIALALPAADAAKLVTKAGSWVRSPYRGLAHYKIGDLIAHLASGGATKAALQLAGVTFALSPSTSPPEGEEADLVFSPEPRGWLEDWHYEEALKKAVPALAAADGRGTLELFCALLVQALRASRRSKDDRHVDHSYIWHEAIEEDEHPPRLRNSLISAVRNTADNMVLQSPKNLGVALGVLREYDWPVFKRIELYLLRRFADIGLDEIAAVVPGLIAFDAPLQHEGALLLKSVFEKLPAQVQDAVLRRIDAGPEEEGVKKWLEFCGEQATPEKIADFGRYWRAQRFALVADHVPDAWGERVRTVMASVGSVRALDEVNRGATWVGPSSPKTAEELAQLGPAGVLGFLRDWQPTAGMLESTPEGLGRILQEVIGRDPTGYVALAAEFQQVDPTFVRFFFSGLETALKESRSFAWQPVLALAGWVVAQPRDIPGRKKAMMEADPSWEWTRGTIATLLEAGLSAGAGQIDFADRALVWGILEPLTGDPDPTLEHEAKYGGTNMEPATMAINTVRGKAFNAVIEYALWVRRHVDRVAQKPPMTLDVMPEVRVVLEKHLDLAHEPTLTIRSVYGRCFPWLQHLDREWAMRMVEHIFPADPAHASYWMAAWETYVTFCRAYDEVLPLLRGEYARAVTLVALQDPAAKRPAHEHEHLAQHLMAYYWRATIAITDPLLVEFFRQAPDDVRASALNYVGLSLSHTPEVPPDALGRLRELWEWRLHTAQTAENIVLYQEELARFGWWFVSRKFDDEWSLRQLRTVLDATGRIDPDFKVSEVLETLAAQYPLDCVLCIMRMTQADRQGWTALASREHFQAILKTALASGNVEAKGAAERLIQYLVGRGDFEYRRLLS